MLQEAFDKVSARASQIQEQYKNVSVQLVQAKMVLKNYGEMQAADAMLIAQASEHSGPHSDNASVPRGPSGPPSEASGRSHATHSSAPIAGALSSISEFPPGPDGLGGSHPTSANPGTVPTTNSIAELSRTDPSAAGCNLSGPGAPRSEAGSTSSSVASYLPRRAGRAAQGGAEKQATGEDSSPLHMSAQLANSQLKARLQQQRADAAESRERLLQRRLAEMEAAAAAGDTPAGAADNRLDVLKACPLLAFAAFPYYALGCACTEPSNAFLWNDGGAVQGQVAQLEKHVANTAAELAAQQDRADALTAHLARGPPGQPGDTRPASEVAGATSSQSQAFAPTLAPIPGSPSVPVHAQQGLTGADSFRSLSNASFLKEHTVKGAAMWCRHNSWRSYGHNRATA